MNINLCILQILMSVILKRIYVSIIASTLKDHSTVAVEKDTCYQLMEGTVLVSVMYVYLVQS